MQFPRRRDTQLQQLSVARGSSNSLKPSLLNRFVVVWCMALGAIAFPVHAQTPAGPSELGQATINCVALNRIDLVVMRTKILDRLRTQRIKIMENLEKDTNGAPPNEAKMHLKFALRTVEDMKLAGADDQPFAGMVRAFVRKFTDELNAWAVARGFDV